MGISWAAPKQEKQTNAASDEPLLLDILRHIKFALSLYGVKMSRLPSSRTQSYGGSLTANIFKPGVAKITVKPRRLKHSFVTATKGLDNATRCKHPSRHVFGFLLPPPLTRVLDAMGFSYITHCHLDGYQGQALTDPGNVSRRSCFMDPLVLMHSSGQ